MALAVGLDIGSDSIKAVALNIRGRSITLQRYLRLSLDEARARGVSPNEPASLAAEIGRWLESERFPRHELQLAIAGRDSIIRYSNLPTMPPWRLKLIMEYEIKEVAEKAGEALTADYAIVPVTRSEAGFCVLVALAKDSAIEPMMASLLRAGVDVSSGQAASVALGDSLRFMGDAGSGSVMIAQIGRQATEVSLIIDGALVFARSVSLGGDAFTEKIARHYKISEDEAEACKLSKAGPGGEGLGPVVKPVISQLGSMLKSTLSYAQSQLKLDKAIKLSKVLITGGSARLPTLPRAIGDVLDCPGELWDPLASIDISTAPASDRAAIEKHGIESAVACGLALKHSMQGAMPLDLLPASLAKQRTWTHRTQWMIAAAVLLGAQGLVSLGLSFHRLQGERQREATLRSQNKVAVEKRVAAQQARSQSNEARERLISALASRARAGVQIQGALRVLAQVMPSNITITKLDTQSSAAEKARSDARSDNELQAAAPIMILVEAEMENSQLLCEQQLAELEDVLRRDPAIDEARTRPTGPTQDPRVKFEMTIKPAETQD